MKSDVRKAAREKKARLAVFGMGEPMLFSMEDLLDVVDAYPQEAEPDGRLWVGSGDSQ